MSFLQKIFGIEQPEQEDPNYCEALARVEQALGDMAADQALFLAGFALLLARVAYEDQSISEEEKKRIRFALEKHGNLTAEQAALVENLAVDLTVSSKVEHHIILRKLNEVIGFEQKLSIVRALLHVASDEDITEIESNRIAAIASSLLISREEFLRIRSEFREHLRILKNLPTSSK